MGQPGRLADGSGRGAGGPAPVDVERYRENWQDEVDSASEYRAMAASETDPRLARVYANLAQMEERHIAFWESRLLDAGAVVGPPGRPGGAASWAGSLAASDRIR